MKYSAKIINFSLTISLFASFTGEESDVSICSILYLFSSLRLRMQLVLGVQNEIINVQVIQCASKICSDSIHLILLADFK